MIRILLAEDEQAMREYLARALEKSGYEVVSVDRGTDAAPLLEESHFDLLLTDIVMPEMDGIELARHCARVSPKTEVMFITGFSGLRRAPASQCRRRKFCPNPSTSRTWCSRSKGCSTRKLRADNFKANLAAATSSS